MTIKLITEAIVNTAKIWGGVVAISTVIISVALQQERHKINTDRVNSTLDTLVTLTTKINNKVEILEDKVDVASRNIDVVSTSLKSTQKQILLFASQNKSVTKQEIIDLMNNFDFNIEKKNLNYQQIHSLIPMQVTAQKLTEKN